MEDVRYLREGFEERKPMEVPLHPGCGQLSDSVLLNCVHVDFKVSATEDHKRLNELTFYLFLELKSTSFPGQQSTSDC